MTLPPLAELPFQSQFAETERWPADKLRAQQFRQLGLVAEHARRTVPFYRARFAAAGITGPKQLARHWHKLPVLTRREVQAAGTLLHSAAVPAGHGAVIPNTTSGSTGMPVTVLGTELDARFFKAFELRTLLWHGFDFQRKLASIRKLKTGVALYPEGIVAGRWGDTATFPFATGPAVALNISSSIDEQAEFLTRHRPDYLTINPTTLAALIEYMAQRGMPAPPVAKILTTAEMLRPELRAACRDAWGADIVDVYSAQEVGPIAVQCPEQEHYHVQAEHSLVEIVDDKGEDCAPGEIGRVVVTPLHNFAMPLFRYAIGDYAEIGEPCPCGRGLPVLRRILGRSRNMLVAPDGQRYWPFFGATGFRRAAPVSQYQFVQTAPDAIEARLVVERALTDPEEAALRARIEESLPFPCRIAFRFVPEIPRREGGKYEDFISEVATAVH